LRSLSEEEIAIRVRLRDDFKHYAAKALKIRSKDGSIEPLILNKAQDYIHTKLEEQKAKTGRVRALILKGRQQGCSTLVAARFYHATTHRRGVRTFILTHEDAATQNLFEMVNRYHEHVPPIIRPSTGLANAKELFFDRLDSGYKVGTAGTRGVGRSSTIQLFHGSEVALWPFADTHAAGIMRGVSDADGTEIILESTAHGVGNFFHRRWQAAENGESEYQSIFVPWFWQDEYRRPVPDEFDPTDEELEYGEAWGLDMEQIAWRRRAIEELGGDANLFKQEYPACVEAGERVGTSRGLIPISDVVAGDVTAFGRVTAAWCSGHKPVVAVTTKSGFQLLCTEDHRLLMPDGEWVAAGQSGGKPISLSAPKFAECEAVVEFSEMPLSATRIAVTERLGLFLGYFMGDGSFHDSTLSIACDGGDADVVAEVVGLVDDLFGQSSTRIIGDKKGCAEVRFNNKRTLLFLQALDLVDKRGTNGGWKRKVHIPDCIWRSPRPVVAAFLAGLFEADGFSARDGARVILFSKHGEFLRDVQRLLLGFGIVSITRSLTKRSSGHEYVGHELRLTRNAAIAFSTQIGFRSARKQDRVMSRAAPGKGRPASAVVMADEVVSVEPVGIRPVYDLTIEGGHRFDASGVVVHNCASEAFQESGHDSYIPAPLIVKARKATHEASGPLVIGYDPAWTGSDRHAMAWRKGRKLIKVERKAGLNTMQAAGWCKQVLDSDKPVKLFIDVGGVGAGVYDRLCEMGYGRKVVPVNFGSSPEEPSVDGGGPLNRRAEIWMRSKKWLEDEAGADIPDEDALQADACGPGYKYDSLTRLQLEKKEDMRRRGVISPDLWDAVALTFAEHIAPEREERAERRGYDFKAPKRGGKSWMAA